MKRHLLFAGVSSCCLLAAAACNGPSGPVAPAVAESPQTAVLLHPQLETVVAVPADPAPNQGYTYEGGNLRYTFRLQNKTDQTFFLRVKATFYDENRVPVDDQLPMRVAFNEYEDKVISVICSNADAKEVKVQVNPAN